MKKREKKKTADKVDLMIQLSSEYLRAACGTKTAEMITGLSSAAGTCLDGRLSPSAAPALPGSVLLSAPPPTVIPHPASTQPSTIHSISWISGLNLQRLSWARDAAAAPSTSSLQRRLRGVIYYRGPACLGSPSAGTSLSQCFPRYPLLSRSPESRVPALLLLGRCHHRGPGGSCTLRSSQIQAVELQQTKEVDSGDALAKVQPGLCFCV